MANIGAEERNLTFAGHHTFAGWNRKQCFEARDTLFDCTDKQSNHNKYRCPDELYAYEMWCPADFRRVSSYRKRKADRDELNYDKEWILKNNLTKQSIF